MVVWVGGLRPRERSDHVEWSFQEYTINILIQCSPKQQNKFYKKKKKKIITKYFVEYCREHYRILLLYGVTPGYHQYGLYDI